MKEKILDSWKHQTEIIEGQYTVYTLFLIFNDDDSYESKNADNPESNPYNVDAHGKYIFSEDAKQLKK